MCCCRSPTTDHKCICHLVEAGPLSEKRHREEHGLVPIKVKYRRCKRFNTEKREDCVLTLQDNKVLLETWTVYLKLSYL